MKFLNYLQVMYRETFLSLEENCAALCKKEPGLWNLTYLAVMLFSNVVFTAPWLTTEIMQFHGSISHMGHSVSLTIYALNFYVPSLICIIMRVEEYRAFRGKTSRTDRRKKPSMSLEESYRLRRAYSIDVL